MQVLQGGRVPIKAWVDGVPFEDAARKQVEAVAKLPFVFHHVAVMPDVHAGLGATVGTVVATEGAVIPAAVGVDLGCGMTAVQTNAQLSDLPPLPEIRRLIERVVPHGRTNNGGPGDRGAWGTVPDDVLEVYHTGGLCRDYEALVEQQRELRHPGVTSQLGTLGTGNHFIEVCLDPCGRVWIMLHSGSRGAGAKIGSYFTNAAKRLMSSYFIELDNPDLAYLPEESSERFVYVWAVNWAQRYAKTSRAIMLQHVLQALGVLVDGSVIDCHHNYLARETHFGRAVYVTRKGAISARLGEWGIIPGSMGARSYIVVGRGNPDSFMSCSHGAGRAMSRTQARRQFTVEDHARMTEGVECRKDVDVVDETPGAYKSIDAVLKAESDLVDVVIELKQAVCVKG